MVLGVASKLLLLLFFVFIFYFIFGGEGGDRLVGKHGVVGNGGFLCLSMFPNA